MMETRRNTAEAIQRGNEYYESIESYKAASWLNPLSKFTKKQEVRKRKHLTRQSNYSLRSLNESMHSGSDTSSICASSGSPPGSNLAVHDIQDWAHEVSDNWGSSASLHSASNNSNAHAHLSPVAAASVSDFGHDADAESYAAAEAEADGELESVDNASDAGGEFFQLRNPASHVYSSYYPLSIRRAGQGRWRYAPYVTRSPRHAGAGGVYGINMVPQQDVLVSSFRTKRSRGLRVPTVASLDGRQGQGELSVPRLRRGAGAPLLVPGPRPRV
ncbi:hypothetical protein FB451DRAFT_460536 [Mycena latifolia]|nr:hypothetical protein FB451DRAFT_460536 [Mycena latifolia]